MSEKIKASFAKNQSNKKGWKQSTNHYVFQKPSKHSRWWIAKIKMCWSAYTWSHSSRFLLFRNDAGTFGGIERGQGRGPTAQQIRAQEFGGFFQTRHGDPPFGGFGCGVLAQQEVCLWGLPPATRRSSPRDWGMHLINSLINRLFFWSTPICVGSPNCSAQFTFKIISS